jgi:hypothetical protein
VHEHGSLSFGINSEAKPTAEKSAAFPPRGFLLSANWKTPVWFPHCGNILTQTARLGAAQLCWNGCFPQAGK